MSHDPTPEDVDLLREHGWRLNLDTYAHRISRGHWKRYQAAVYMARAFQHAALTPNSRLIIVAPPRHTKSTTCMRYGVQWS